MKTLILLLGILFSVTSYNSYAATSLLECNSCSFNDRKVKVLSAAGFNPISVHYVIDLDSDKLYYYQAQVDQEIGRYIVTDLPISDSVQVKIDNFFLARRNVQSTMLSNPDLISSLISTVASGTSETSPKISKVFRTANVTSSQSSGSNCSASDKGVHDFLLTSSFRKNVFDQMNNYYPNIQNFFNTWNAFVNSTNVSLSNGKFSLSVEANFFALPQTINFPDGGRADVVISKDGNTFDVVKGSAFDCNNNEIPTTDGEFNGNFIFNDQSSFNDFQNYGSHFNIHFSGSVCQNNNYQTRCFKSGDNKYTCVLYCP